MKTPPSFSLILSFSLMIFFAGCHQQKIIPLQKMKLVLWDITLADEYAKIKLQQNALVFIKKENLSLYNKVFSLHQVSKDEFYESYTYYQSHPIEMKTLLDSLAAYGIRKRDSLNNH